MTINSFDDVISAIKDETARQALIKEAESNPEIKGGWLRQADYSRKMNEQASRINYANEWDKWKDENWDPALGMTKQEARAFQTIRELETENLTLKGKVEAEMTFEDVQKEVDKMWADRSKGVLTEDVFTQKFGNRLFDKTAYDTEVNTKLGNVLAGVEQLYGKTFQHAIKHLKEFDEVIDPLSIVEYANKNGVSDLEKAYSMMVDPRRKEKDEASRKAEIEAAEKRGEQKARQEQAMGPQGRMPTDSGAPEMGHLQARLLKTRKEGETPTIPDEVKLDGSGALAHRVADLYRQEQAGKAGA